MFGTLVQSYSAAPPGNRRCISRTTVRSCYCLASKRRKPRRIVWWKLVKFDGSFGAIGCFGFVDRGSYVCCCCWLQAPSPAAAACTCPHRRRSLGTSLPNSNPRPRNAEQHCYINHIHIVLCTHTHTHTPRQYIYSAKYSMKHLAVRLVARGQAHSHQNALLSQLFLCVSRACLGKMIIFIYKLLKKMVFLRVVVHVWRAQRLAFTMGSTHARLGRGSSVLYLLPPVRNTNAFFAASFCTH